jgi:hypothetical protein
MNAGALIPFSGLMRQEFLYRQTDVFGDLAEQNRGDIADAMKGDGCAAAIRMAVLSVGPALTHLLKPERFKNGRHPHYFPIRPLQVPPVPSEYILDKSHFLVYT